MQIDKWIITHLRGIAFCSFGKLFIGWLLFIKNIIIFLLFTTILLHIIFPLPTYLFFNEPYSIVIQKQLIKVIWLHCLPIIAGFYWVIVILIQMISFMPDLRSIFEYIFASTSSFSRLEIVMKTIINKYYNEHIELSPKAIHALSGTCVRDGQAFNNPEKFSKFGAEQVFERLIASSPALSTALLRADINIENIKFWGTYINSGFPQIDLTRHLFQGTETEKIIHDMKYIDEYLLYRSILENIINKRSELWLEQTLFLAFLGKNRGDIPIDYEFLPEYQIFLNSLTKAIPYPDSMISTFPLRQDIFELVLELDNQNHIKVRPFGFSGKIIVEEADIGNNDRRIMGNSITIPHISSSNFLNNNIINQFQDLLNSDSAHEIDYQRFFTQYPFFLTGIEYARIYPQLVLTTTDSSDLIPDFFLVPHDSNYVDLMDIKLPYKKLVTNTRRRRIRFSSYVRDAIAQLLDYKRYFADTKNRIIFAQKYRLRGYHPKMIIVIGRDYHLPEIKHIIKIQDEMPNDMEIMTYDSILKRASKYINMVNKYNKSIITGN